MSRSRFTWLRAALLKPLRPGARVIVISSGAAIKGSPLSGGYAGAKATQRFITGYAQDEARRAGVDITFSAILPRITPLDEVGRPAIEAYAARAPLRRGAPRADRPAGHAGERRRRAGRALQADAATVAPAYLLTGAGLQKCPEQVDRAGTVTTNEPT
jgi:NAD(P)-dependent dehydrogenase (short-subunit alcohol dehydrogenase family)